MTNNFRFYRREDQPVGLMSCRIIMTALGRTEEARGMMCRVRKVFPGENLDYRVCLARGSYMSETTFTSSSQHFVDVWSATQPESRG